MKNITVSIDDKLHHRARVRAAERNISLSAAVREFLTEFAGEETEFDRRKRLQKQTLASIKYFRAGDRLKRDEVYAQRTIR